MTTCKELCKGLDCTIIGTEDEQVTGLAYRSDAVQPGDMFFCIVGLKVDGHSFAQDAIDRGAKFIVVERKLYLANTDDVTLIVVEDSRKAMAHIASRFFGDPSRAFQLVGVTGTNGKTTTTYLVQQIARAAHKRTGVIGTVGIEIEGQRQKAEHTTPESPDLQRIFATMRDAHCDVVAMEVSSHALDLERTWGTTFAVTCFTNLTQDHLDYHHTFEAYFEAKARLFSQSYPAKRVICIDDKWGRELLKRCSLVDDLVITTGFDTSAQIHPLMVDLQPTHTSVELEVLGNHVAFDYPLVGRFNVSNIMNAYAIGLALGLPEEVIIEGLSESPQVAGRLERVTLPVCDAEAASTAQLCSVSVFVDYAHTPDALQKAIDSIKGLTSGRTIVVFGCGGDRDATKRSIMGRVSLSADLAIVTSDNPRTEDPDAIIADIVSGMGGHEDRFIVQPDRKTAIACAVDVAKPGDSVLIAGKGHEDYQIIGSETIHFDDREVATQELLRVYGEQSR